MNYMFENQECSSGCESGWTLYLDHSSIDSPDASYDQENECPDGRRNGDFMEGKRLKEEEEEDEEDDEDLSMVSDASSGPPHLHEEEVCGGNDNNGCFYHCPIDEPLSRNSLNRKKNRENRRRNKVQDQSSLLDDTASSPFFDFCNKSFNLTNSQPSVENVLEYSQGYSTTQFEVRPPYQEHYEFFQSPQSGNQLQQQNQWFEVKGGDTMK